MHSLIYSLPPSALTRFSWLQVKETQLKLSSVGGTKFIGSCTWKSPRATAFLHWGLTLCLCLPSPFLLSSSYFFSSPTSHLPNLQSGSLLVASKEPPAALNKHLSNLATQGREIVYHWQEPKKPWGGGDSDLACVICPCLKPISEARSLE